MDDKATRKRSGWPGEPPGGGGGGAPPGLAPGGIATAPTGGAAAGEALPPTPAVRKKFAEAEDPGGGAGFPRRSIDLFEDGVVEEEEVEERLELVVVVAPVVVPALGEAEDLESPPLDFC